MQWIPFLPNEGVLIEVDIGNMYWEGVIKYDFGGIYQYLVKLGLLFMIPLMGVLCHLFFEIRGII
jgi:hypothetical protein